jgi:hypothetical protein
MTQVSQPRRTRILPPQIGSSSEKNCRQEKRDALAAKCRVVFERLRPHLIESHFNWHIAIDPDSENYLIDPTLKGITEKISDAYDHCDEVKLTIYRLNDTGSCGTI